MVIQTITDYALVETGKSRASNRDFKDQIHGKPMLANGVASLRPERASQRWRAPSPCTVLEVKARQVVASGRPGLVLVYSLAKLGG